MVISKSWIARPADWLVPALSDQSTLAELAPIARSQVMTFSC
jgi:hypothetical protein